MKMNKCNENEYLQSNLRFILLEQLELGLHCLHRLFVKKVRIITVIKLNRTSEI